MKKPKVQDLYDYTTDADRLCAAVLEVKNIVHGFGYDENITDLEKLHLINDAVSQYNRNYIDCLRYSLKEKKEHKILPFKLSRQELTKAKKRIKSCPGPKDCIVCAACRKDLADHNKNSRRK